MKSKADDTPAIDLTTGELGRSGTYIAGGVISGEEYNFDLTGQKALKVYDRMRRSDATVRQSLAAIKELIKAAEMSVDAASDDQADIDLALFVEECLFERVNWAKFKNEALTALDFGFSVFEMVFEPVQYNGKTMIGLTKLGFRKQTTVFRWETEDQQPGITQHTTDGHKVSIPLAKLFRFTINQEGDNYEGISILRTAYKHWSMKEKLERIDVVGHDRHATGVVDITYGKGVSQQDKEEARRAARNMRANEESYVDHNENVTMQFMDMKSNTLRDITPSIERHDRQILRNVMAQFMELGGSSAGSRSTSEDHSKLFEKAVSTVAKELIQGLNQVVVQTLVDLNATVKGYPKLRIASISDDNIQLISDAIKKFVEAGVFHPRPVDENTVRKMVGFSEIPEDELKEDYAKPDEKPDVIPDEDEEKNDPIKEAAVTELKALRASVEKALYDTSQAA